MQNELELSVVICTRNRRECLRETLRTILPQQAEGSWEMLVVDNGSSDGTGDGARELAADFPVDLRVEDEPRQGLSFARNTALEIARGRAIVYLDDDVNCRPGWLAAKLAAFRAADVLATAGRILPLLPAGTPDWFHAIADDEIGGPTSRYDFGEVGGTIPIVEGQPHPFGANMGMLREAARACGGFRTDLGWGKKMIPCEETEFFRRLAAYEGRMEYVPAAAVEHRIGAERVQLDYFLRWNEGYGRATAVLDGPFGFPGRLFGAAREVGEFFHQGRRVRRLGREGRDDRKLEAMRKRAHSGGRLKQLLGL